MRRGFVKRLPALAMCLLLASGCGSNSPPKANNGSGGNQPGGMALSITPSMVRLKPGGMQDFSCNLSCTFAVQEGAEGGTISDEGAYTAPDTFGTYHVVA